MRHIYLFMLLPLLFISCGRTQVSFTACQPEQLESSTTFTPFEYRIFVTNPF
ncbi:MAG: hypothetical protein IKP39_00875 [Paludibacteraceae bacterium]|nr:hypothetical protein [Paludibacteraceae bacterium]